MDEMLEKQRKIAEAAREEDERTWRELSPSRVNGGHAEGNGEGSKEVKSPVRKRAPSATGSTSGSSEKSGKNGKGAGADIRSFFSPQKKK